MHAHREHRRLAFEDRGRIRGKLDNRHAAPGEAGAVPNDQPGSGERTDPVASRRWRQHDHDLFVALGDRVSDGGNRDLELVSAGGKHHRVRNLEVVGTGKGGPSDLQTHRHGRLKDLVGPHEELGSPAFAEGLTTTQGQLGNIVVDDDGLRLKGKGNLIVRPRSQRDHQRFIGLNNRVLTSLHRNVQHRLTRLHRDDTRRNRVVVGRRRRSDHRKADVIRRRHSLVGGDHEVGRGSFGGHRRRRRNRHRR